MIPGLEDTDPVLKAGVDLDKVFEGPVWEKCWELEYGELLLNPEP